MKRPVYLTTAIDYPNGHPHLGHAYEKVVTDFYARFYRQNGHQVSYLTGTDENGQKLKEASKEAGQTVQAYVDSNVAVFRELCARLSITNDDFIRTSEDRHHQICQWIWTELEKKELIYRGEYSAPYCIDCETFYTEAQLVDGKCPFHGKELPTRTEVGYFFKLSNFQQFLIDLHTDNPTFLVPNSSRKEILSRLKQDDLRDLSISRPNEGWGVPVPGDDQFVMYTWFDALINYYAATKNGPLGDVWPASTHVIGKDIAWFHTVIWPAMLQGVGIELPRQVYVHGMVLAEDGRKMSKSLGNGVAPFDVLDQFERETFRYYLLSAIPAHGDGRFSLKEMGEKHNTALANDLGNLVSRVVKLAIKKCGETLETKSAQQNTFEGLREELLEHVRNYEHDKYIERLWREIYRANQVVNDSAPWKLEKGSQELQDVLYECTHMIHVVAHHLYPVMPEKAETILGYLGRKVDEEPAFGPSYQLSMPDILFAKVEV